MEQYSWAVTELCQRLARVRGCLWAMQDLGHLGPDDAEKYRASIDAAIKEIKAAEDRLKRCDLDKQAAQGQCIEYDATIKKLEKKLKHGTAKLAADVTNAM